ncbi:MAG: HI1506-related protein [Rhodospirillales bacterium]|jgi:hypothetical protein|nr:HI1506-related protein [Rhodospirillales bacterium]
MKVLRITAKRTGGFRRCGVLHPASAVDHEAGTFSAREIALLKAEPMLVVQEVDLADPKPEPEPEPLPAPEPAPEPEPTQQPGGATEEPAAAPPPDRKPASGPGKGGKTKTDA